MARRGRTLRPGRHLPRQDRLRASRSTTTAPSGREPHSIRPSGVGRRLDAATRASDPQRCVDRHRSLHRPARSSYGVASAPLGARLSLSATNPTAASSGCASCVLRTIPCFGSRLLPKCSRKLRDRAIQTEYGVHPVAPRISIICRLFCALMHFAASCVLQSGRPDSNRGPRRPERRALPGCATPRRRPKYPTQRVEAPARGSRPH